MARGSKIKLAAGDVLEVTLLDGRLAYVQVTTEKAHLDGQILRVLQGRYHHRVTDEELAALCAGDKEYSVCWDMRPLVHQERAVKVASCPVPASEQGPIRYLRKQVNFATGELSRVDVINEQGMPIGAEVDPDGEDRKLPQWWTGPDEHVLLVLQHSRDRSLSVQDVAALEGPSVVGPPGPEIIHFLVFKTRKNTLAARQALETDTDDLTITLIERPGTDIYGLAVSPLDGSSDTAHGALETRLRALARAYRGVYDGHETRIS